MSPDDKLLEQVARAICNARRVLCNTVPCECVGFTGYFSEARAAIAAMQPRWRDVKTDPPPRDGTPVLMAYAADGKAHLVAKYGVGAYSGDILWEWGWAMPPTHWQPITPIFKRRQPTGWHGANG